MKGQYSSPIEDSCEILFMKECFTGLILIFLSGLKFVLVLQQNQTDAYNQLISCLTEEEQKTLRENIHEAEEQQLECILLIIYHVLIIIVEKYKQEEEQRKQMKGLNRV